MGLLTVVQPTDAAPDKLAPDDDELRPAARAKSEFRPTSKRPPLHFCDAAVAR